MNNNEKKIRPEDTVILEPDAIAELSPKDIVGIRAYTSDGEEVPEHDKN